MVKRKGAPSKASTQIACVEKAEDAKKRLGDCCGGNKRKKEGVGIQSNGRKTGQLLSERGESESVKTTIDDIFKRLAGGNRGGSNKQEEEKEATEVRKKSNRSVRKAKRPKSLEEDLGLHDQERLRYTEDGLPIYTEDSLNIGTDGKS